jgi:ABC-type nickel/cobalt efflux system permease component RcnA
MISDSALNLALKTVSLSRSLYDSMTCEELQQYLQDFNYKYKHENFEDAKNILLEAKYYNPYTLMFAPMASMMNQMTNFINRNHDHDHDHDHNHDHNHNHNHNLDSISSNVGYSYKKEIRSSNGNGYIKEENYSYNGKDKPIITSTYRTITNGKIDGNKTIKN